jgi:hypothetical protein
VGPSVAQATTIDLRDGVLYVRARDAAWLPEVERSAGLVRQRMRELLGEGVVRTIIVPHGDGRDKR